MMLDDGQSTKVRKHTFLLHVNTPQNKGLKTDQSFPKKGQKFYNAWLVIFGFHPTTLLKGEIGLIFFW
ncbi:MAG: hypothetical protein GY714_18550 [Desulfobacterales bacterium]|nr:hypothetical protein [Desulfobacterales bacterium]